MSETSKRILIRRTIHEVITVNQEPPKTFVCEYCGIEQTLELANDADPKQLTNGENSDEINNQKR